MVGIGINGPTIGIGGGAIAAGIGSGAVYESKTESATATFAKPSGTEDGDLLVYLGHAGSGGSVTLPAGWTSQWTGTGSGSYGPLGVLGHTLATKIADSEPASWTFTNSARGVVLRYSANSPDTPVDVVAAGAEVHSSKLLSSPDVTTTQVNTRVIHLLTGFCEDTLDFTPNPPSGTVERVNYRDASSRNFVAVFERTAIQAAAGATGQTAINQNRDDYNYTYPLTLAIRPTGT